MTERFLGWTERERPQIFEALAGFFQEQIMQGHALTNEQVDAIYALAATGIAPTERLHLGPTCPQCGYWEKPNTDPAI